MKKKIFMFKKLLRDWQSPKLTYQIAEDLHDPNLNKYYFIFREKRVSAGKDQALISKFDENGIPINKTYIDVTNKEYVYSPISIGQMGLAVFHTYITTKAKSDKERFVKFADWFYNNAELDENLGAMWMTEVGLPQYKNPGPWQSAFSQSRAISILLRGYQLTKKQEYAEMATKALISFSFPVNEGGVTSFTKWGPFYEEYPASVPTLVLNGMIFSLCGVYDYIRVFPNIKIAHKIFDDGIGTLLNILPEYDLGFWSRYNLCLAEWHPQIDPATIGYQRLHITQLNMLHKLTGKTLFKTFANHFKKQDTLLNAMRMYRLKLKALKKIGRV